MIDLTESTASFGTLHFGEARLGHVDRTQRLVLSADVIIQHPGGTLPQKFQDPTRLDAFYRLANANMQITAFVFDVVRARVPRIKLDDLFEKKDEIADAVKNELSHVMYDFGYGIVKALVTDIDPDAKVKQSMNEINAAQRMRIDRKSVV